MTEEEVSKLHEFDWYQVDMDRLGKEKHQYNGISIPFYLCYVEHVPLDEDYLSLNNIDFERVSNLDKETELGFHYFKTLWDDNNDYNGYEERTIKIKIPNVHGEIKYVDELQYILRNCGNNSLANNFKLKL